MKDIYDYGKLISENEFKAIIIKEIYFNNLVSYVNEIEVSDRVPFARYYCDRKKLCFNFDAILRNNLIKASKFKGVVDVNHNIFKKFAYYDTFFSIKNETYSAKLNIGIRKNGFSTLYDINPFSKQ